MRTLKFVLVCSAFPVFSLLVSLALIGPAVTAHAAGLSAAEPAVLATEPMTTTTQAGVEPSKAQVRKLDGGEVELDAPLSIQGELEAGCGWRFLALDTTQIREIQRQEDGQYVLLGDEGELIVSAGWSAIFGQDEWGYERIPIAEVEFIRFEGGSPSAPEGTALYWSVTDDCGQESLVACPRAAEWTSSTCLPGDVAARYGAFQLKVLPESIASVSRSDDAAGGLTLRLADGSEINGVVFAEDAALTGQIQFGHLAIPLAQVRAMMRDPAAVPIAPVEPVWEVLDLSGGVLPAVELNVYHVPPQDSDPYDVGLSAGFGEFRLTLDLSQLQALHRDSAESESFTLLDANGISWRGLTVDPDQGLEAKGGLLGYTLAISDVLGVRVLNLPPPEIGLEPAWIVTDTQGSALPATSLGISEGVLAGAAVNMSGYITPALAISVTEEGLSLSMLPPLGKMDVISGTLTGDIAPGQGFAIPVRNVAAVEPLKAAEPVTPVAQIGAVVLKGGQELPVSYTGYRSFLDHFSYGVKADLVEYYLGNGKILEDWGFHVTDDAVELSCIVSGVCPRGELMYDEGDLSVEEGDEFSWYFGDAYDAYFSTTWADVEGYRPAELPPLEDFAPTVAITVTGWQDQSETFLVRNVRFMQTRRLSRGWCCASPSIFDYATINIVETGGVTRTVEVESLAAIEFDEEYGRSSDVLPMRLVSRRGGTLDVALDPVEPEGHSALYWDRSREGLLADAGDGLQVIFPFRNAKRIELGWLK